MELMLVRHADAEPGDGYAEDALRPLTKKGSKMQEQVAMALRKLRRRPDRVFTSPRLRALQTAQISAEVLGAPEPEEWSVLEGGYRAEELLAKLSDCGADQTIMCVGHEPDMGQWAARLLAGDRDFGIRFKKSAVLGLSFAGPVAVGAAELLYFYRPKDLQTLL